MEILGLVLALIPLIAVVLIGGQMMKTRALARAAENAGGADREGARRGHPLR